MGRPKPPGRVGLGEGGAQPLSGLVCPLPLAHEAPQHLSGLPKHLSVMLAIAWYLPELIRCPNNIVQYIDLYVSTISRLLVMSAISSGTPNNLRSSNHINS